MTQPSESGALPPKGWYPDPVRPGYFKYWNGDKWSDHEDIQPALPIDYRTPVSPAEAQANVFHGLIANGAQIVQQQGSISGTVSVGGDVNVIVGILLFLLCIVPFIIYVIMASRRTPVPLGVQFWPDGAGTFIRTTGQGVGLQLVNNAVRALPSLS